MLKMKEVEQTRREGCFFAISCCREILGLLVPSGSASFPPLNPNPSSCPSAFGLSGF